MVAVDLAWAAGFFDGEGNTLFFRAKTSRAWAVRVQISQVDRSTLDRFAAAVGVGVVRGPYPAVRFEWSPSYRYTITGIQNVKNALEALWPYLSGPKKAQAMAALDQWERRPLIREGCRHLSRRTKDVVLLPPQTEADVEIVRDDHGHEGFVPAEKMGLSPDDRYMA